jgi:hypothetical protein
MSKKVMSVLPEEVHDALVQAAKDQGRTKSAMLTWAAISYLKEHGYLPKE